VHPKAAGQRRHGAVESRQDANEEMVMQSDESGAGGRSQRRSYGTGSLYVRTDRHGRDTWYGYWRTSSREVRRRVGLRRIAGSRDGLTRSQAEAELRRLIGEVKPKPRAGELLTVEQAGERYLQYLQARGRKPSTIAAVRGHLTHWHTPFFAEQSLDAITTEDVADLIVLMHDGKRPSGITRSKKLSPASIRKVISTLHALFDFAMKRGGASRNPVDSIELPEVVRSDDIRFLTPVEVHAVAASAVAGAYQAVDRALYVTAAMTGLREGELIALRWRDVDWTAARVRVRQNYVLGEFGTPKSRRSTRSVPMADAVATELERLYRATHARSGREPRDDELVFADPTTGGPLNKKMVLRRYRQALKAARLDSTHRFHDLRHTFGTQMAAAGVAIRTLQEWMGHRDIQTTMRYADYTPSTREAELIAAAFDQSRSPNNADASLDAPAFESPEKSGSAGSTG
jgi:integrase